MNIKDLINGLKREYSWLIVHLIVLGIALIVNGVIVYYQYKGFRVLHPDAPLWTFFFK
jgi:hypothetical protein